MAITGDNYLGRQMLIDAENVEGASANAAEYADHNNSVHSVVTDYDFGDWLDGAELGTRISPARRFFSLFATFDALLCTVLWLVSIVLSGKNLLAEVQEQVLHYTIKTSLFDVIVAAFLRFLLLILVYVVCKSNHWLAVALSTACTSVAAMVKIVYFTWHASASTVSTFQATLLIVFFILGWLEVWLLDNKVLPQERRAQLIVARRYGMPSSYQGANLAAAISASHLASGRRLRDFLSTCTGSVTNFYSPMGSPAGSSSGSNTPAVFVQQSQLLSERQLQLRVQAEEGCRLALDVLNAPDWQHECQLGEADFLYWRRADEADPARGSNSSRRTQYKFTCRVECPSEMLADRLIFSCDQCVKWNSAIESCCCLEKIDQRCEVRCQRTTPLLGGAVSPRCFVQLVLSGQKSLTFFSASVAVQHSGAPEPQRGAVHAVKYPSIVTVRPCVRHPLGSCVVEWLIDADCRPGVLVPRRVIERGTVQAARALYTDLQQLGTTLVQADVATPAGDTPPRGTAATPPPSSTPI